MSEKSFITMSDNTKKLIKILIHVTVPDYNPTVEVPIVLLIMLFLSFSIPLFHCLIFYEYFGPLLTVMNIYNA